MTEVRMTSNVIRVLPILLLLSAAGPMPAQSTDFSGKWAGDAVMPGSAKPERITLDLRKSGDAYEGTISDTEGLAKEAVLEDVTVNDLNLRFKFTINRAGREVKIKVALNRIVGRLVGGWWADDVPFSPLDLAPQPKKQ
jgi:hypothetical protein